jgi:hypothetical protein
MVLASQEESQREGWGSLWYHHLGGKMGEDSGACGGRKEMEKVDFGQFDCVLCSSFWKEF